MNDLTRVAAGVYAYGAYRIEGRSRRWYWHSVVDPMIYAGPFANIPEAFSDLRSHIKMEVAS